MHEFCYLEKISMSGWSFSEICVFTREHTLNVYATLIVLVFASSWSNFNNLSTILYLVKPIIIGQYHSICQNRTTMGVVHHTKYRMMQLIYTMTSGNCFIPYNLYECQPKTRIVIVFYYNIYKSRLLSFLWGIVYYFCTLSFKFTFPIMMCFILLSVFFHIYERWLP